jgi:hypothetical protein
MSKLGNLVAVAKMCVMMRSDCEAVTEKPENGQS